MSRKVELNDVIIRSDIRPGDLGYVMHLHGKLYGAEYGYSVSFETYVGYGLYEFFKAYDQDLDRVWIAEHEGRIIGFLCLQHREPGTAQLRYFLIEPAYRGIGLGKRLMELYMDAFHLRGYKSSYLLTTDELYGAASLYKRHGFNLVGQTFSTAFGKPLYEQRYELELNSL